MNLLNSVGERKNRIITDIKFPCMGASETKNRNEHKKLFDLKKIKITNELFLSNKEIECCYYLNPSYGF